MLLSSSGLKLDVAGDEFGQGDVNVTLDFQDGWEEGSTSVGRSNALSSIVV